MSFSKTHSEETKRKISEAKKGKPSWNKGLRVKETHPQMGFQKENQLWDNPKTQATQFKDGQRPSPETEFKKGQNKGEKNFNWLVDRGKLTQRHGHAAYNADASYREWMLSVKRRDGWKCRIGNQDCKGPLEAHHILSWRDYPELRYKLNNGISLCHAHHPRVRSEEMRLALYFSELILFSTT